MKFKTLKSPAAQVFRLQKPPHSSILKNKLKYCYIILLKTVSKNVVKLSCSSFAQKCIKFRIYERSNFFNQVKSRTFSSKATIQ